MCVCKVDTIVYRIEVNFLLSFLMSNPILYSLNTAPRNNRTSTFEGKSYLMCVRLVSPLLS